MPATLFKAYSWFDASTRCERHGCAKLADVQITEFDSNKERALICAFHADQDYVAAPNDGSITEESTEGLCVRRT